MKNKKYLALFSCAAISLLISSKTYATDTSLYTTIKTQVNSSTDIDFTKKATPSTGNGNGVNKYTEKNKDVYYFRGEVNNNNVILGDMCWKIVRTTYTKGIKLIYNGAADNNNECLSEGRANVISDSKSFSGPSPYPLFRLGYMGSNSNEFNYYGLEIGFQEIAISKNATWDEANQKYVLDTSSSNNYAIGSRLDIPEEKLNTMFYICMNGETSCEEVVYSFTPVSTRIAGSVVLKNGKTLEDFKAEFAKGENNSEVKTTIDTWFRYGFTSRNNEDDLEDAIYCNDREIVTGPLSNSIETPGTYFAAYERNFVKKNGNYHPSLDCNKRDSFTKDDTINGNGQLSYKVGMLTADEATLAGAGKLDSPTADYLPYLTSFKRGDGNNIYSVTTWTMSPFQYSPGYHELYATMAVWRTTLEENRPYYSANVRPVIALKAGAAYNQGDGTEDNPYIISSFIDMPDDEDDSSDEKDGNKKEGSITPEKKPKNPNTGDTSHTMLFIAGASVIAILAFTKLFLKRR